MKDLCTCAKVCKLWRNLSDRDCLWRWHYKRVQLRLKKSIGYTLQDSYKKLVLRRGTEERSRVIQAMLKYSIDYKKHIRLNALQLSTMIEITGKKAEYITSKSRPIQPQLTNSLCATVLDLSDLEMDPSSIDLVTLYCLVPMFPERLVHASSSPCQSIQMKLFPLNSFPPVHCTCQQYSHQRVVRLHNCVSGLLIGQWEKAGIAFIHASYTLVDVGNVLHSLLPASQSNGRLCPNASEDAMNNWAYDLNAYLICTNGNGNILFANTWRSFDCPTGHKILINRSELNTHIPFDRPTKTCIKVGAFDIVYTDMLLLRFLVFSADGNCLLNLSQWASLEQAKEEPVQFGEEEGDRWRFEIRDTIGHLIGMILRNPHPERKDKLIELELSVKKKTNK